MIQKSYAKKRETFQAGGFEAVTLTSQVTMPTIIKHSSHEMLIRSSQRSPRSRTSCTLASPSSCNLCCSSESRLNSSCPSCSMSGNVSLSFIMLWICGQEEDHHEDMITIRKYYLVILSSFSKQFFFPEKMNKEEIHPMMDASFTYSSPQLSDVTSKR